MSPLPIVPPLVGGFGPLRPVYTVLNAKPVKDFSRNHSRVHSLIHGRYYFVAEIINSIFGLERIIFVVACLGRIMSQGAIDGVMKWSVKYMNFTCCNDSMSLLIGPAP